MSKPTMCVEAIVAEAAAAKDRLASSRIRSRYAYRSNFSFDPVIGIEIALLPRSKGLLYW
jgi:hypothetical protein